VIDYTYPGLIGFLLGLIFIVIVEINNALAKESIK